MKTRKAALKTRNYDWILASLLIVLLIILTFFTFACIENIRGNERVVTYTGIVHAETQRLVKLELTDQSDDDLMKYLDGLLDGLHQGGGTYQLTQLNSKVYQKNLDEVIASWDSLKEAILQTRKNSIPQSNLLEMSEIYYSLTNDLVRSAENYFKQTTQVISYFEISIIINLIALLYFLGKRSYQALALTQKNGELIQRAYVDIHTGLPNKNKCEQILTQLETISEPTCCMMFDLNCLKQVNDTLGHIAGDALIQNFARVLRYAIPNKDFVGRYGGDEFMAVIYDNKKEDIEALIQKINNEVIHFNSCSQQCPISFACGYAHSTDYDSCSLKILLGAADQCMYVNKAKMKALKSAA